MTERTYEMITTLDAFEDLLDIVGDGIASLDFETTGLRPAESHVRLGQICNADVWAVVDFWALGKELVAEDGLKAGTVHTVDRYKDGFKRLANEGWFEDAAWIVFNAGFELRWFIDAGAPDTTCWDVGYLRRAIDGGGHFKLAQIVKWDLDIDMPKEQQLSDWSLSELDDDQLDYAADDALYTWDLWVHHRARADDGHMNAFNLLNDMVPAVIEMEETGILLDPEVHMELVDHWEDLRDERLVSLRKLITEDEVENFRSGKQWSDFFSKILPDEYLDAWPKTAKTGLLSTANKDLRAMSTFFPDTPIQDALVILSEFKTLDKYISSFGETLVTASAKLGDGRVRARYNIAAAKTCRYSSSGPNLQQTPRDREFFGQRMSIRKSFIAPPERRLISLDYSGIELRVLALLAEDDQLLEDMVTGDVHLEVGSYMAGRRLDKKIVEDKEIRQNAKGVSFGIIYGASAFGISATMKSSISRAQELIDFWADRYPRAFDLRNQAMTQTRDDDGYLRVVDGGTIWMGKRPALTQCANYPVQRGALSVMARAITRHYDTIRDARDRGYDVHMISTIHDALIDEADARHAPQVLHSMKRDMVAGYSDIFPSAPTENLLEGGIGISWGELEDVAV